MAKIKIGKKYVFDTKGYDSTWKAWDGMTCTVLRPLTEEEADISELDPMFRIRFDDDAQTETDAFDDELYGPYTPKKPEMFGTHAEALIADLDNGLMTTNHNRMSRSFVFATVAGKSEAVSIRVIEYKHWPESASRYVVFFDDAIDNVGGCPATEHLSANELAGFLDNLAYDAAHGRI